MTTEAPHPQRFRVLVAGGGIAALETALALQDLAAEHVETTMLAPNEELVYRPMSVREPFGYGIAARYPLGSIAADAGAQLVSGKVAWVEPEAQLVHTDTGAQLEYDALVVAMGAMQYRRYEHAITIDDRHMDELLHGLIQDLECGFLESVAFVVPGRMAWPLPLYELALMLAGRAEDMCVPLDATMITPEEHPLAIFGQAVSDGVHALLAEKRIRTISSAYVEIPAPGRIVVNPGDRRVAAQRVIALPELYGPGVQGLPLSEHGFLRVDRHCQMRDVGPVFAVGDVVDFPVKQGGIACQQADAAAQRIAALAGADVEPQLFKPYLNAMLLTDGRPRYLAAEITGGCGAASRFSDVPMDGVTHKVAGRYLAPYLARLDREGVTA